MSRKRGKNKPSKSKAKSAPDAGVPEEVLAEGSGPNETVEADIQALADAASDALPPPADVEIKAKKTRLTTDAWGQPIEIEEPDEEPAPEAELAADIEEEAVAETQAEEQQLEAAVLEAEAVEAEAAGAEAAGAEAAEAEAAEAEAVEPVEPVEVPDELAAVAPEGDEVADEELGAALPTTAASMDDAQLKNLVEALVFASDKPVTVQRLRQLSRVSDVKRLEMALEQLAVDYAPRGIALQQVSGGYQFRTNTQYSVWVQQLIAGRPVRLSRAQLETLAIVAYRQPITRPEVDDIRGVDSSATLRLLLDRSLIRVLGKKEDVGRPTLYGTTKEFLDFFSLSDLRELPTLREYSELTAESRKVMSDRLGIDADAIPSSTEGDDLELEDDAPPVDQAADDAAAVAAVAAVTDVYGVEDEDSTLESSSTETEGEALEASATEDMESSSEDAQENLEASSAENMDSSNEAENLEASPAENMDSSNEAENLEASPADDVAASNEVDAAPTTDEAIASSDDVANDELAASNEQLAASDDAANEQLAASDDVANDELAASDNAANEQLAVSDDVANDELAASDDADVGMPRGAAQRDIIGRSTDLDEDPELRAAAEAELDAATARANGDDGDLDASGASADANEGDSEAFAGDESSTGDLDASAGEGETDESSAANAPDSSVLDASTAESLDETDEPPAD